MFLLDTDTCIHILKARTKVIEHFENSDPNNVFLSSITYHELLYGALHSAAVEKNKRSLENFIHPLNVLPFTRQSAIRSSSVREALAAIGKPIGPLDNLIAGHALEHGLIVVTNNTREFSRVEKLELENWAN